MYKNLLRRNVLWYTLWILAISTIIIPIQFSQAQSNQWVDLQESVNTTSIWSSSRKEICSKLNKNFPFWKTMKILWIDSEDYKYYAQYYNIVDSIDKYAWKANQNYNLQLAVFNNCEIIPSIDSIKEGWNIISEVKEEKNIDFCKKSPLYIEHWIYEEDCKFTNKCEEGYKFIEDRKVCKKEIKVKNEEIINEEKKVKENIIVEEKVSYSEEDMNGYQRAKEQWITTMNTIDEARLSEPLTRAELAKMVSVFSTNILWKEIVNEESGDFIDVDSSLWDLEEFIQQAYKFQLMWTWSEDNEWHFYPNAYVTRAEFATVLSRMIFGDKFNQEWERWYAQHLYVLKKSKLLDNKKPEDLETKSYVLQTLYKIQWLWLFQNIIPKENPLIDTIEKFGINNNKNNELNEYTWDFWTWIKLNYDGVLLHIWFSSDDYKQTLVQYAYKLWGMDFVYMIECENGNWDINAVGDSWHAFWLCQMNDRYHKNFPEDYKTNWIVQIEYCYEKRKWGTKFYGPSRWVKGQRCYNYVKNRFSLVW